MSNYVNKIEADSTAFNYLIIQNKYTNIENMMTNTNDKLEEYPKENKLYIYDDKIGDMLSDQNLNEDYVNYIEKETKDLVVDVAYKYDIEMNIITNIDDKYKVVDTTNFYEILDNDKYIKKDYDVLATTLDNGDVMSKYNELALVVDKYNRVPKSILDIFGIDEKDNLNYNDFLGKEIKLVNNNDYYENKNGLYIKASNNDELEDAYNKGKTLKIVSIIRANKDASNEWVSSGIAYTKDLTDYVFDSSKNSDVVKDQIDNKEKDVTSGLSFINEEDKNNFNIMLNMGLTYEDKLNKLGATKNPNTIIIYPKDYDSKNKIIDILDEWNKNHKDSEIKYTDISSIIISMLDSMINIVSYVLIAFSSISLVVSSIMIAIVIYNSVIERIKEIGILRAMGARKKDISRVFKCEAIILGMFSGIVAMVITYIICIIINKVLLNLINVSTIANLTLNIIFGMIALSVILTFVASIIPAKIAAKKEPVDALRSE